MLLLFLEKSWRTFNVSLGRAAIFSHSTKARNEQSRIISSTGIKMGLDCSSVQGTYVFMQMFLTIVCVSAWFFLLAWLKAESLCGLFTPGRSEILQKHGGGPCWGWCHGLIVKPEFVGWLATELMSHATVKYSLCVEKNAFLDIRLGIKEHHRGAKKYVIAPQQFKNGDGLGWYHNGGFREKTSTESVILDF